MKSNNSAPDMFKALKDSRDGKGFEYFFSRAWFLWLEKTKDISQRYDGSISIK